MLLFLGLYLKIDHGPVYKNALIRHFTGCAHVPVFARDVLLVEEICVSGSSRLCHVLTRW